MATAVPQLNATIHFLHIAKTAGSALRELAQQVNAAKGSTRFRVHGHQTTLADLREHHYVLAIRNPVSRFRSAFVSRRRQGRPLYNAPWSKFEEIVFSTFKTPNDLAVSIFEKGKRGDLAYSALSHIPHFRNQKRYTDGVPNFLITRPPLAILRQEQLESDLHQVFSVLAEDQTVLHETLSRRIHENPYTDEDDLSEEAITALERWYCQDIEYVTRCHDWIENQSQQSRHE